MHTRRASLLALLTALLAGNVAASTRIKDIAYVQGVRGTQLIGYGLVVGLNGTGDSQRSNFTLQSVASMLRRFGVNVPQADLRVRNVAAVMVTATVPGFARAGGVVDVIVSSLGDAQGLQGGTLLLTPLSGIDGIVYATGQGPLSVGGMSVASSGSEFRRNHTAAGRVPGGAILERAITTAYTQQQQLTIVLNQPDFTTAVRVADRINSTFDAPLAHAADGSSVVVSIPDSSQDQARLVGFISSVELLEIDPDVAARVVINERTGTIVVGGNVGILPVAISHGGFNIEVQSVPVVSQPNAFSKGETVTSQMASISAAEDSTTVVAFEGMTSVQDVARALNSLRVSPRDIIAIFQSLKEAGALKAELVIM